MSTIVSNDPRLYVMISSTTVDLPEHRHEASEAIQRNGHTPVMMELGSAEWNSDAIKFSLEKVEKSQVYIGIFGLRYGYIPEDAVRNPDRLSITELEYRHAQKLGIPILIYIAAKSHPFEEEQIDFEPEKREKLKRLKEELTKGIVAFFDNPLDLRSKILQSLHELKIEVDTTVTSKSIRPKRTIPDPPALYAVPDYTLTNGFVGRRTELAKLDDWAKSTDAIMVVEGIGGLGKSALTWEWVKERSATAIPNYAGGVWWSFYEKGTSMVTFVRHALAYVTGVDPESLIKDSSHYQRGQQLLAELRKRPFLLVLDGFERVLTAYHRLDKAQLPDDQADQLDLRECVNPADGELLMQLLKCGPSKILVSTRLFPTELQDRASHKPIPGVAHHHLNGLSPPDALALVRQAGVTGSETEILKFADQFGRHSLLLRIVCGMIADYRKKPLDFDAWRADPIYGGSLKLSEIDLKQRYTHILKFALAGLDETTRNLLSRIAVISENATYDTLLVLNPFLPPTFQNAEKDNLASQEYREAMTAFDAALKELEDRGLLQWDRDNNRYEMHPVVRAYAAESLDTDDRVATFDKVRDHFASLPPDDLTTATELAHIAQTLEIYRCLVGAGKLSEAGKLFRRFSYSLNVQIGAFSVVSEFATPLLKRDSVHELQVADHDDARFIRTQLAFAHTALGHTQISKEIRLRCLEDDLLSEDWHELLNDILQEFYCTGDFFGMFHFGMRRHSVLLELGIKLADMTEDQEAKDFLIQMKAITEQTQNPFCESWDAPLALYYREEMTEADAQEFLSSLENSGVVHSLLWSRIIADWNLCHGRYGQALELLDKTIQFTHTAGVPGHLYHELRSWALAALGRPSAARAELQLGEQGLFAAEAHRLLGELDEARTCALNAYRHAWGEGPPYIHWYNLKRSRKLLQELGEPEPQLPLFDPTKVEPIPFEKEIREAIAKLNAEKAAAKEKMTD